jgi:hypothetical protein
MDHVGPYIYGLKVCQYGEVKNKCSGCGFGQTFEQMFPEVVSFSFLIKAKASFTNPTISSPLGSLE